MNQIRLISALCATAILSAGVTAWASATESAWVTSRPLTAGHDLKGRSAPLSHINSTKDKLLAGQDLRGVSAPPGYTSDTGTANEASKASGAPSKSLPWLA